MAVLRKHSLFYTVKTDERVVRKNAIFRFLCNHEMCTNFTMIDHTVGPGSFADNYEGIVCRDCGEIMTIQRTF